MIKKILKTVITLLLLYQVAECLSILIPPLFHRKAKASENGANPWGCTDYQSHREDLLDAGLQIYTYSGGYSLHTKTVLNHILPNHSGMKAAAFPAETMEYVL